LLVIFDDHHLGTSMPSGGHPPHQLVVLPFRPLLTGENLSRMIQVSNFDQTVTG